MDMSVHAGSRGQLGCIFLIPFPKQPPHLETPLAPVHRSRLQRAIASRRRWGGVGSPRLQCGGSKCQLSVLTRTGLGFPKTSFDLRDLGIFTTLWGCTRVGCCSPDGSPRTPAGCSASGRWLWLWAVAGPAVPRANTSASVLFP